MAMKRDVDHDERAGARRLALFGADGLDGPSLVRGDLPHLGYAMSRRTTVAWDLRPPPRRGRKERYE